MIALPIAVWTCSCRRSIAATSSSRSRVGCCTTTACAANATMPMRTSDGCSCTNAFAASRAAAIRLGATSVARIDSDVSIARTIVRCSDGSVTVARGRATATMRMTSPSRNSSGGTCRRIRREPAAASRSSARLA